jgi:hypothetical protein
MRFIRSVKSCTASIDQRMGNIDAGTFNGFMTQASPGEYVSLPTPILWLALMRFTAGQKLCRREQSHGLFPGSPGSDAELSHRGAHVLVHERRTDLRGWF